MEVDELVNLKVHPNDEMMNYVIEMGWSEDGYFNEGKKNALAQPRPTRANRRVRQG